MHVADDPGVRGDHRAGPGGGDTQEVHHLAAQELSDAGAQDFPPVGLSVKDITNKCQLLSLLVSLLAQLPRHFFGQTVSYVPKLICVQSNMTWPTMLLGKQYKTEFPLGGGGKKEKICF